MSSDRPTLLVFCDSLSYYGPTGGLPSDDPRIRPNIVANQLGWDLELIGRIGWTCRDVWWAATQDPRAWAALPRAGAVIFATGGMDSLPSPLPTALRELIRYVRPPWLRRWVRDGYGWMQPRFSPISRAALPPHLTAEYLEMTRNAIDFNRPGIPIVASLPAVHIADTYGKAHHGREGTAKAITEWAEQQDVPLVDQKAAVGEYVMSGRGNPDGIHWNFEAHQAVADSRSWHSRRPVFSNGTRTVNDPIVVVTDSSSRLSSDHLKQWDIRQVPLHVLVDGIDLRDGVDDVPYDIHELARVTTAGATPVELAETYSQALADSDGDGVVAVHISAALSSTVSSAVAAAREFGPAVRVINSRSAAMGSGSSH